MLFWLSVLRDRLGKALWFIPALFVLAAVVLAEVLPAVERALEPDLQRWPILQADPSATRTALTTIATAMFTVTGVLFSVTMLVLQTAGNQLSPRVMQTFLRDRQTQIVLGLFVATFVFALFSVRHAGGGDDNEFVPALSLWTAFGAALLSVGALVSFINHIAQSIRASTVIRRVANETWEVMERWYPPPDEGEDGDDDGDEPWPARPADGTVHASSRGVLTHVDEAALIELAARHDCRLALIPLMGDFVPRGGELIHIWGDLEDGKDGIEGNVKLEVERTLQRDTLFGIRQLVDIAERALSPSLNDPTTAVQAIDYLHDLLREMSRRRLPPLTRRDEDGVARLRVPRPSWDETLNMAVDELRRNGSESIQVLSRLRSMLLDLLSVAPPDRRGAIERQLELLEAAAEQLSTDHDRAVARTGSRQGHGPA